MTPEEKKRKRHKRAAELQRIKWQTNPEWKAKTKARQNNWRRTRKLDPEYRLAVAATERARRSRIDGFIKASLASIKCRSKDRGYACDLDFEYLMSLVPEDRGCPVFPWVEMRFSPGGRGDDWETASVDRIVPALGYVKGNVRWICTRANRIRNNATALEMAALLLDQVAVTGSQPASNEAIKEVA